MTDLRQKAASVINDSWKYSASWDKKAKKYNCSWKEIALQDCYKRIHELENQMIDLEDIRLALESKIEKYNS